MGGQGKWPSAVAGKRAFCYRERPALMTYEKNLKLKDAVISSAQRMRGRTPHKHREGKKLYSFTPDSMELSTAREIWTLDSFPAFYGTRRFSTEFTCPYPEPDQTSPHHPIPPLQDPSSYYPITYVLVFLVASFPLPFPPITYSRSSSPPFLLHAPPISSSSTSSF
jgi:hypothetical protein